MKEVTRSYPARFEAFIEMIEEIGHKRGEYREAGVLKQKLHNLYQKSVEERFKDRK